jgi:hypothetical protein
MIRQHRITRDELGGPQAGSGRSRRAIDEPAGVPAKRGIGEPTAGGTPIRIKVGGVEIRFRL